jgi:chromosome segregation ATPase
VRQIHSAIGKDRDKLLAELKEVVSRRFDVIMARKQLQYDDLKKRLEDLQKEVTTRENELDKLKSNKDNAVKEHFDELLKQAEKMQWD